MKNIKKISIEKKIAIKNSYTKKEVKVEPEIETKEEVNVEPEVETETEVNKNTKSKKK